MSLILAIADSSDRTAFNMQLVLVGLLVAAGACILGAIPIVTARRRKLRQIEGIAALMILWGLLSAGSVIYTFTAHMNYAQEYQMRLMQNFDPRDQTDRPGIPWLWWTASAAAWGGALLWASTARSVSRRGFDLSIPPPTKNNQ